MITLFIGGEWDGREDDIHPCPMFFVRMRVEPANQLTRIDYPEPSFHEVHVYELSQFCGRAIMVHRSTRFE